MATGALDANGIWQYGEDDSNTTFSALLNRLGSSTSTQIASAKPSGRVLQTVSVTKTNPFSAGQSVWTDITGLSATITPRYSTSKILVTYTIGNIGTTAAGTVVTRLMRGNTPIGVSTLGGGNIDGTSSSYVDIALKWFAMPASYLDSPASTSAQTYKVQCYTNSTAVYINAYSGTQWGSVSTITLQEIAA